MDDKNRDDSPKQVPIRDLKVDPEAQELFESPAMKPYMNLVMAMIGGRDSGSAIKEIAALPLEERYVWRVASALKWAFTDLETPNVEADRQTLSPEDRLRLVELLKHRPLQFCLFLSTLLGQKQMEHMMLSAIKNSRAISACAEGAE